MRAAQEELNSLSRKFRRNWGSECGGGPTVLVDGKLWKEKGPQLRPDRERRELKRQAGHRRRLLRYGGQRRATLKWADEQW